MKLASDSNARSMKPSKELREAAMMKATGISAMFPGTVV